MLTISIIFAVLVAVWGFSGTVASDAKRRLADAKARPRPVPTRTRPVAVRTSSTSRTRGTRPVASA